jgi:3'(2'), 5'-bisphosphate nucleotidase
MNKFLTTAIKELIIKAGTIALDIRDQGLEIEWKEDNSPVTNADKAISQYIFEELSKLTPQIPIICEERPLFSVEQNKQFWLIDPIDGTRSFISNHDSFTVNIALIDNKEAVYGFIYKPTEKLLYFTDEAQRFCVEQNGSILNCNSHNQDGYVAVVSSHHFNSATADYLKNHSFKEVISVPSSIKLCLIAEGTGDVYPKFGQTMEWDIAAGHALIKATGGDIRAIDGGLIFYAKEQFKNPHFIARSQNWVTKNNPTEITKSY